MNLLHHLALQRIMFLFVHEIRRIEELLSSRILTPPFAEKKPLLNMLRNRSIPWRRGMR